MKNKKIHIGIVIGVGGLGVWLSSYLPYIGWIIVVLSGAEILFRTVWSISKKESYVMRPKVDFGKLVREPLAYIPFSYKKNAFIPEIPYNGPYHQERNYKSYGVKTNSYRISNGEDGGRDVIMPKPQGLLRINCLGASTTATYLKYQEQHYSYPLELEKILQARHPERKIEVNNFGHGGWNSADILVDFLLKGIDTKPDVVVIYHALNDLPMSLTDNFDPDYSHYKRNFELTNYFMQQASKLPKIPFALYDYLAFKIIGRSIHTSSGIVADINSATSKAKPNLDNNFQGLGTYERNIEHIINICTANNIKVILSTFCYFPPANFELNKTLVKYKEGLDQENDIIRKLAAEHNTGFVDIANEFPLEEEYFIDSIHFSHMGMRKLAEGIAKPISECIDTSKIEERVAIHE